MPLDLSPWGQVNRSTSACSVPLCASSAARNANGSCSTGPSQLCYSYQVPLTNQTFCAPSVSCSLFEPCADNVACSSNTSICLSTTCCQRSICMPIVLGVTACNSSEWRRYLHCCLRRRTASRSVDTSMPVSCSHSSHSTDGMLQPHGQFRLHTKRCLQFLEQSLWSSGILRGKMGSF